MNESRHAYEHDSRQMNMSSFSIGLNLEPKNLSPEPFTFQVIA